MHELSIALSLVELATEESRRHEGMVRALHVRLGPLSGVVKEALVSAYDLVREGTDLAEAALVIEDVAITGDCPRCRRNVAIDTPQMLCCPVCESPITRLTSGRDLELVALEIA